MFKYLRAQAWEALGDGFGAGGGLGLHLLHLLCNAAIFRTMQ